MGSFIFSSWEASEIPSGVPPSSILGPLLFIIFMWDILLKLKATHFTGYADDNTPFVLEITTDVMKVLEAIGENLVNWFSNNEMKLNTDVIYL